MENEQVELLQHSEGFICISPYVDQRLIVLGTLLVLCLWSLRRFKGFGARHSRKRRVGAGVIYLQ